MNVNFSQKRKIWYNPFQLNSQHLSGFLDQQDYIQFRKMTATSNSKELAAQPSGFDGVVAIKFY